MKDRLVKAAAGADVSNHELDMVDQATAMEFRVCIRDSLLVTGYNADRERDHAKVENAPRKSVFHRKRAVVVGSQASDSHH